MIQITSVLASASVIYTILTVLRFVASKVKVVVQRVRHRVVVVVVVDTSEGKDKKTGNLKKKGR